MHLQEVPFHPRADIQYVPPLRYIFETESPKSMPYTYKMWYPPLFAPALPTYTSSHIPLKYRLDIIRYRITFSCHPLRLPPPQNFAIPSHRTLHRMSRSPTFLKSTAFFHRCLNLPTHCARLLSRPPKNIDPTPPSPHQVPIYSAVSAAVPVPKYRAGRCQGFRRKAVHI